MIATLQAENLARLKGLRHAFFERRGGVSAGAYDSLNGGILSADDPAAVRENRRRAAAHMGVAPERFLSCRQVHSARVVTVGDSALEGFTDNPPEADALVTARRDVALVIQTADCVPVLFVDPEAGVLGAAHAGWRGALGGALEATLAAMEALGACRPRISAALGPCIAQASYEVDAAFPDPFLQDDATTARFFVPAPGRAGMEGKRLFDLPGYVTARLRGAGVEDIQPSPADTCANPRNFFSYRRNTLQGLKRVGGLMSCVGWEA